MAIEHFDEKIAPDIKRRTQPASGTIASLYDILNSSRPGPGTIHASFDGNLSLSLSRDSSCSSLIQERPNPKILQLKTKSKKLSSVINLYKKQSKIIKTQSKQITNMMKNMKQMKRRLDETEVKNREFGETIRQLKESSSKGIATESSTSSVEEPAPHNMKKRTATIILKRRLDEK